MGMNVKDTTGLGLGYRLIWRLEYAGLTIWGPAEMTTGSDPKSKLRLERALKIQAGHEKRGTPVPDEVLEMIGRRGGRKPFRERR